MRSSRGLLAELPSSPRRYQEYIDNMPFFFGLEKETTVKLCMALRPLPMGKDEVVFTQGDTGKEMCALKSLQTHVPLSDTLSAESIF